MKFRICSTSILRSIFYRFLASNMLSKWLPKSPPGRKSRTLRLPLRPAGVQNVTEILTWRPRCLTRRPKLVVDTLNLANVPSSRSTPRPRIVDFPTPRPKILDFPMPEAENRRFSRCQRLEIADFSMPQAENHRFFRGFGSDSGSGLGFSDLRSEI